MPFQAVFLVLGAKKPKRAFMRHPVSIYIFVAHVFLVVLEKTVVELEHVVA